MQGAERVPLDLAACAITEGWASVTKNPELSRACTGVYVGGIWEMFPVDNATCYSCLCKLRVGWGNPDKWHTLVAPTAPFSLLDEPKGQVWRPKLSGNLPCFHLSVIVVGPAPKPLPFFFLVIMAQLLSALHSCEDCTWINLSTATLSTAWSVVRQRPPPPFLPSLPIPLPQKYPP